MAIQDLTPMFCSRHGPIVSVPPTRHRGEPGLGFTHHEDVVIIASPSLGALINRVRHCDRIPPRDFGAGALMRNLAARGLLRA